MKLRGPADGRVLTALDEDSPAEVRAKAAAARRGQARWAAVPLARRKAALARFAALVAEDRELLAAVLTRETGKPLSQSLGELNALGGRLRFFLDHAAAALRIERVRDAGGTFEEISHEPLGVVANISAWNYPWFVGTNVFVPALLMGNAVLYKPSEHAALTGLAIALLLWKAGVPRDAFIPVIGAGKTGAALLEADVDAVFFTGSHATGLRVAAAAARRLIKVQLELGGKDPAYAAADAAPAKAGAALAEGAFYNNGQSCCAVERIYVHARIYDRFIAAFLAAVKGYALGDPMDKGTFLGPLAREEQLTVLAAQVKDARRKGARLLLGGGRLARPGYWFAPTVLDRCDHSMSVMREESFGPVIGIMKVSSDEEAVRLMNDTEYGLTAAVYSKSRERARRILSRVDSGSAYWNCCDRVSPYLPWSGRRHSGLGLTLSKAGITAFLRPKAWHLRPG
ncbi:MAG: aldehyde dehydrogenase family protein [Elusimicrobia bacterium]|nr:aldehyde dehydrogenase family protein [Elusimicrobiota bacterium]